MSVINNLKCLQISSSNPRFIHLDGCNVKISLVEFLDEDKVERASLLVVEARGIAPYHYRTSLLKSILVKDGDITVETRNSTYKFKCEGVEDFYREFNYKLFEGEIL